MGRLRGRLRRLLRALLAQEAPDDAFALRFLEGEERELYLAMDPRDRAHGVRVALLHDAGKAVRPYRTLERVLAGLFAPPLPPYPLRRGLLGAFQVRRHHPLYAAQRIRDPRVRALVLEHHAPKSLWGRRLHEADREE